MRSLRRGLKLNLVGFGDLTPPEIARATGLDLPSARLAAQREFDEPFWGAPALTPPQRQRLGEEVGKAGLELSLGGRFHHLHGPGGKARAVAELLAWLRESGPVTTVGLGDAPNDWGMLALTDHPQWLGMPSPPGGSRRGAPAGFIPYPAGPVGWNRAVLALLRRLRRIT